MNVFELRDDIVDEYARFVGSFVNPSTPDVAGRVSEHFESENLWPEPMLQLNPAFEPGKTIDQLVEEGILHEQCSRIFRVGKDKNAGGTVMRLHRHQEEAVRRAVTGANYVLTTGTGSGKSLAYIIPIVNHVLHNGTRRGIQAIVVYPMNALANSQHDELAKFLVHGFGEGNEPVSFAAYTGQEDQARREVLLRDPPDILLTNYVMLELILTRFREREFIRRSPALRFIVLDELHTYRGRQGSDVSMLVRRVRAAFNAHDSQCVGTSATLAGPGSYEEQQQKVSQVAGNIFGVPVSAEHVVGETVTSTTEELDLSDPAVREELVRVIGDYQAPASDSIDAPQTMEEYRANPLTNWIEWNFGLEREPESGRLRRRSARPIGGETGAARALADQTNIPEALCATVIRRHLLAGVKLFQITGQAAPFAFRLHQFISRGDTVYATPEPPGSRHVTVHGQQFVPGDRDRKLFPLLFCRECGQEYYPVHRLSRAGTALVEPRDPNDLSTDDHTRAGYLYISVVNPWPEGDEDILSRLPEEYLEPDGERRRVHKDRRKYVPQRLQVSPDGTIVQGGGTPGAYVDAPFRFCLNCGSSFNLRMRSDFSKLGSLATEGRSSATSVLSVAAVRRLRVQESLPREARKLLSFTDNRQDASLQTGHFNDFVQVGLLRGAVYSALARAAQEGLRHDAIVPAVFQALSLSSREYSQSPLAADELQDDAKRALRDVLGYFIYRDQERGWRLTAPNLEQVGLLKFDYVGLKSVTADESRWADCHEALRTAAPSTRERIARVLLDYFRRELAIKVDYLESGYQEGIQARSSQHLVDPWRLEQDQELISYVLVVLGTRPKGKRDTSSLRFVSPRSGFGQYLRRITVWTERSQRLTTGETTTVLENLVDVLTNAGLLQRQSVGGSKLVGHAVPAAVLVWKPETGESGFHDPIRQPTRSDLGANVNQFFVDFYMHRATELKGLTASEHTAQVPNDKRKEREQQFKEAELPVLYASPTLELGVDIKELNVVNMRNVPPTPANYAQRSGRAGRNGQPALVLTYCSTFQSHDQYFFARPHLMVSGAVTPPRVDLLNEELLRAHIHAIWLGETGQGLPNSIGSMVDIDDSLELPVSLMYQQQLSKPGDRERTMQKAWSILEPMVVRLREQPWYQEDWLRQVVNASYRELNRACDRWRELYRTAKRQREYQHQILGDQSRSEADHKRARRLRNEAEAQLELLTNTRSFTDGDFYSYRYLASEGFLPGYNFPRLPVTAYLPGRRGPGGSSGHDEILSRPRFLAISEFGPKALVYHEGSRYRIERLMLPLQDSGAQLPYTSVKICPECGYLHQVDGLADSDVCEQCEQLLNAPLTSLIQMTHVGTRRVDRISSDEEERQRTGYEIRTALRYAGSPMGPQVYAAEVLSEQTPIMRLEYGHSASVWRINLGWRKRRGGGPPQYGFKLDVDRGYWQNDTAEPTDVGNDAGGGRPESWNNRIETVIPFVRDTRNVMIVDPFVDAHGPDEKRSIMASLQAALKQAIQAEFDLEESELAAEPLPGQAERRRILFYEAGEGGAGVLQRLIVEEGSLNRVARRALDILHFDPETGEDLFKAPHAEEQCEAACYDCLMTYTNQTDHPLLDRQKVKDFLLELAQAELGEVSRPGEQEERSGELYDRCETELERRWLQYLEDLNLTLPSGAQKRIAQCNTRPDFVYEENNALIYIDGPVHEYPQRRERDREQTICLEEAGYYVIRFGPEQEWDQIIADYPAVFGRAL